MKSYKLSFLGDEKAIKKQSRKVQEHAFKLGYKWYGDREKRVQYVTKSFLFFNTQNDNEIKYSDTGDVDHWIGKEPQLISVDDFLALPISKLPKFDYSRFGCHEDAVKDLVNAIIKELKK